MNFKKFNLPAKKERLPIDGLRDIVNLIRQD